MQDFIQLCDSNKNTLKGGEGPGVAGGGAYRKAGTESNNYGNSKSCVSDMMCSAASSKIIKQKPERKRISTGAPSSPCIFRTF